MTITGRPARALLEELRAVGVEVRVDGGGLEYEGPEDAITPEVLERLAAHRAQIMAFLSGPAPDGDNVVDITDRLDTEARKLHAAGWQPKERLSKTIWRDPADGFWVSEEMALLTESRREGGEQ